MGPAADPGPGLCCFLCWCVPGRRLRHRDSDNVPPLCWGLPVYTQVRVLLILNQLIQKPAESSSEELGPSDVRASSGSQPPGTAPQGHWEPRGSGSRRQGMGYSDRTAPPQPSSYARTGHQILCRGLVGSEGCGATRASRRRRRQGPGSGVCPGLQHGWEGPLPRAQPGWPPPGPWRGGGRRLQGSAGRRGNSRVLLALDRVGPEAEQVLSNVPA